LKPNIDLHAGVRSLNFSYGGPAADIFPHSFGIGNGDTEKSNLFYLLLYFSFTTLTSVGFGDITPITHQARSLVIIEQLIGVFFVAVLIARLAGLHPPRTE
jgi:hypothetical protein